MNFIISKINPINYNKKLEIAKRNTKNIKVQNSDTLSFSSVISSLKKREIVLKINYDRQFFRNFLTTKGKVTQEEYEDIKTNHPSTFSKAQIYCDNLYGGSIKPKDLAYISLLTDKYLREKLPNSRIISIGTSPSPITEQLFNIGHEVIFLPVSGLRRLSLWKKDEVIDSPNFNVLMEYLESKNIDNKKLNIILDFTVTGETLNVATEFIKEYFKFDNKDIKKLSLDKDILNPRRSDPEKKYDLDMYDCFAEKISNVPHYPVSSLAEGPYISKKDSTVFFTKDMPQSELYKNFEDYSSPLARAFSLCTMNEIDKLINYGYLKYLL